VETSVQGARETNPFRVLHLRPSAPRELVVEVYWHLVEQVQVAARQDPRQRVRLDELNRAYASLADPGGEVAGYGEYFDRFGDTGDGQAASAKARWFRKAKVLRRSQQFGPWELLHLDGSAPPEVVERVYHFWRMRLRGRFGDDAPELAQLRKAYEAVRTGDAPAATERDGSVSTTNEQVIRVAPQQPVASLPADGPSVKESRPSQVAGGTRGDVAKGRPLPRAVYWSAGVSAAVSRRARGAAAVGWQQALVKLKDFVNDPFHEYPTKLAAETRAPARPDVGAPEPIPGFEERLAALGGGSMSAQLPEGHAEVSAVDVVARLVSETDASEEPIDVVGSLPLCISSDLGGDVAFGMAPASDRLMVARISLQDRGFMLHVVSSEAGILLNGSPASWAWLEDGDRLQIGERVLRFESLPPAHLRPA